MRKLLQSMSSLQWMNKKMEELLRLGIYFTSKFEALNFFVNIVRKEKLFLNTKEMG
jgi:hypothetical protein